MQFNGIYPPVITPFNDDGSIDYDGFAVILGHHLDAGVNGIVLAGTTGEYYAQTKTERVQLMATARTIIAGRVPLIVGVGALTTDDAVYFAEQAAKAGADGILLGAPYYALPTQAELAVHALAVERAAHLPVLLYNYPARTGVNMDRAFLDRVVGSANFCAIKESSGDIQRLHLLAREYPGLQISCGMDDQALEFFAWGATSWTCAGANFLPAEHIALYRAVVLDNDIATGRRIMNAMLPLMAVLEQGGKFVQCIKHGCQLVGLPAGGVRKPLDGLDREEARALEETVRALQENVARITRPAAS